MSKARVLLSVFLSALWFYVMERSVVAYYALWGVGIAGVIVATHDIYKALKRGGEA